MSTQWGSHLEALLTFLESPAVSCLSFIYWEGLSPFSRAKLPFLPFQAQLDILSSGKMGSLDPPEQTLPSLPHRVLPTPPVLPFPFALKGGTSLLRSSPGHTAPWSRGLERINVRRVGLKSPCQGTLNDEPAELDVQLSEEGPRLKERGPDVTVIHHSMNIQ